MIHLTPAQRASMFHHEYMHSVMRQYNEYVDRRVHRQALRTLITVPDSPMPCIKRGFELAQGWLHGACLSPTWQECLKVLTLAERKRIEQDFFTSLIYNRRIS